MSEFRVPVERITVEAHPDASALEIANVQGYQAIVKKGDFRNGQLVAYIPEDAIVPDELIAEMGLTGRLSGSRKNRVKIIRLRGVVSQGLVYPARPEWEEGQDVAAELGITKYEPQLPPSLGGSGPRRMDDRNWLSPHTWLAGSNRVMRYDFDNYKAHAKREPPVLPEKLAVVFSEKLHGTWGMFAMMPPSLTHPEHGAFVVSSKGLAKKGVALDLSHPDAQTTFYYRVAKQLDMERRIREAFPEEIKTQQVFVLGEVIGPGVQDLTYTPDLDLRVFDIYIGTPRTDFLAAPAKLPSVEDAPKTYTPDGEGDLEYFRDSLFRSLQTPPEYIGPIPVEKLTPAPANPRSPAEEAEIVEAVKNYYATNPEVPASFFGVSDSRMAEYAALSPETSPMAFAPYSDDPTPRPAAPTGRFLDDAEIEAACIRLGLPRVPVLYRGPFSVELMRQYTDGLETVGGGQHIREGIVIRPLTERVYPRVGRVILKSVSEAYLFRKGATTEYQ